MRVFVSYAREDLRRMQEIAGAVRAAGHSVEVDVDVVRGGDDFARRIEASIRECEVCVVLWSPASVAGPWVPAEANLALKQGKRVVSVKLVECSVPLPFSTYHMLDFSKSTDVAALLASLAPSTMPAVQAPERPRASPRPMVRWGPALVAVLILWALMAWRPGPDHDADGDKSVLCQLVYPERDSGLSPPAATADASRLSSGVKDSVRLPWPPKPCALERKEYDQVAGNCASNCDIEHYPMRADRDRCNQCVEKKARLERCRLADAGP